MALPLPVRQNLKATEAKRDENLAKAEKATGNKWTFEPDTVKLHAALPDDKQKERLGTIVYDWYLTPLVEKIVKLCADDMSKEALNEGVKAKKIDLVVDDAKAPNHHPVTAITDGVLTVYVNSKKFPSNVDEAGNNLAKLL